MFRTSLLTGLPNGCTASDPSRFPPLRMLPVGFFGHSEDSVTVTNIPGQPKTCRVHISDLLANGIPDGVSDPFPSLYMLLAHLLDN